MEGRALLLLAHAPSTQSYLVSSVSRFQLTANLMRVCYITILRSVVNYLAYRYSESNGNLLQNITSVYCISQILFLYL
jgi:hypothetical protein